MAIIDWNDNFSVNVKLFDEQHRKLIGMINALHDAYSKTNDARADSAVVEEMFRYAASHFETEEKYMNMYGYAGMPEHKAEHIKFIEKTFGFKKSIREGRAVSVNILMFLMKWLLNHIMVVDKKYGSFLNEKGVD